jgi:DNA-binding CsgD family transcriptional regulator
VSGAGPGGAGAIPLTPRHAQIAALAVTGLTTVQIGKRLLISPRTVDAHLVRIYRRAGVGSRAGLAEWMGRRPGGTP